MESKTFRFFTYGTLMKGERNEHLLKDARFVGQATTKPKYRLFSIRGNFHFPALIDGGEQAVKGEVYECPMSALPGMDRMEGHPHFYCRQPIDLDGDYGDVIAYLYVDKEQLVSDYPLIKSGDWRNK